MRDYHQNNHRGCPYGTSTDDYLHPVRSEHSKDKNRFDKPNISALNASNGVHQRQRMVETQIITRDIGDQRVIQAFLKVPRHLFVEDSLKDQAYDDNPLPIGFNQTISQPYMVAYMLQHLNVKSSNRVLEIGTGSGYQTALLTELAKEVYTIERIPELLQLTQQRLKQLDSQSLRAPVYYKIGDGTLGWAEFAPYDRIIISASTPSIPPTLVKQLSSNNGILLCPVGREHYQDLIQIIKSDNKIEEHNLGSCVFVKLVGKEGWEE